MSIGLESKRIDSHNTWKKNSTPKRVLFIRLQAMGDTMITLPYIQAFIQQYPDTKVDFLTRDENVSIPRLYPFNKVWQLRGGRSFKKQLLHLIYLIPLIIFKRYNVVFDLQNNPVSRTIRKLAFPSSWCEFDRFSPLPAGKRTYNTMVQTGLTINAPIFSSPVKSEKLSNELWKKLRTKSKRIVINPAGAFPSRHWPFEHYSEWAKKILNHYRNDVTFVFIGVDRIKDFTDNFEEKYPNNTLNLVNKTTPAEAFYLLQNVDFVLTEDSGLMHMSWISGIPTLALFGSTRSDWSRPLGAHSKLLGSADMECGNCLLEICKHKDNRCLTRYTPDEVFDILIDMTNE